MRRCLINLRDKILQEIKNALFNGNTFSRILFSSLAKHSTGEYTLMAQLTNQNTAFTLSSTLAVFLESSEYTLGQKS